MHLFMDGCRAATPALFEWLGRRRASDAKTTKLLVIFFFGHRDKTNAKQRR
jgi:hypothetical protein